MDLIREYFYFPLTLKIKGSSSDLVKKNTKIIYAVCAVMKDGKPLKSYDEKVLRPKKGEPIVTTDGFTVGEGEFIVDFSQANTNNDSNNLMLNKYKKIDFYASRKDLCVISTNSCGDFKSCTSIVDEKDKSKIMEILDNMKSTIKDLGLTWWYELNTDTYNNPIYKNLRDNNEKSVLQEMIELIHDHCEEYQERTQDYSNEEKIRFLNQRRGLEFLSYQMCLAKEEIYSYIKERNIDISDAQYDLELQVAHILARFYATLKYAHINKLYDHENYKQKNTYDHYYSGKRFYELGADLSLYLGGIDFVELFKLSKDDREKVLNAHKKYFPELNHEFLDEYEKSS